MRKTAGPGRPVRAKAAFVRQKPTRYDRPHYTNPRRRNQTDCLNKP
ncbi:hypothetical protein HMPREF0262_02287 [Clostridium sp. ATCC 29733]|nr:hypothetical protein HMPREF0262_02287 [Clostridium sp. ATCC 29733]